MSRDQTRRESQSTAEQRRHSRKSIAPQIAPESKTGIPTDVLVVEICALVALGTLSLLIKSARSLLSLVFAILVKEIVVTLLAVGVVAVSVSVRLRVGIFVVPVAVHSWLILISITLSFLGRLLTGPVVVVVLLSRRSLVLGILVGRGVVESVLSHVRSLLSSEIALCGRHVGVER